MSAAHPVALSLEGRFGRDSPREGAETRGLDRGAEGCSAEGLSWAAGRRGAGAGGTGNLFNWAEREALPHPRDGARLGTLVTLALQAPGSPASLARLGPLPHVLAGG